MRYLGALLFVVTACSHQQREVIINWEGNKAISINAEDSVAVYLNNSEHRVIGEISNSTFTPAVPFQPGETYLVVSKHDTLYFTIPVDTTASRPRVLATYPSCDTVPSNLLKVYIQFSEPMQEYRSSEFVRLVDDVTGDTIKNAFLDLKPELWNEDGTILTLWIDPGRIKQDLVPNKQLGAVLKDRHSYRLQVESGWKSKKGVKSNSNYTRSYTTSTRDADRPDINSWTISATKDKIIINTKETLDWMLLQSSVTIRKDDTFIESKTVSEVCEQQLIITPNTSFSPGKYVVQIASVLEDPAGNNLNRLFETDVTSGSNKSTKRDCYSLQFDIY